MDSKNKYELLYGNYIDEVMDIPIEIIQNRISLLNKRLTELLEVPWEDRNDYLINKVIKGINFWEKINEKY